MQLPGIAIMLWHTSILILTSSSFVFTSAIKFPGRKESILGKTYFGSEQLFKTEIDDVKPFIAELTLNSLSITTKKTLHIDNLSSIIWHQFLDTVVFGYIAYLI